MLLKKIIKTNGLKYLASPNTESFAAKKQGDKLKGSQEATHILLHSLTDILNLVNKFNLKIILFGTTLITIKDYFPLNLNYLFFAKSGLGSSYNLICQKVNS